MATELTTKLVLCVSCVVFVDVHLPLVGLYRALNTEQRKVSEGLAPELGLCHTHATTVHEKRKAAIWSRAWNANRSNSLELTSDASHTGCTLAQNLLLSI